MSDLTRRSLIGLATIAPLAIATSARAATHEVIISGFSFSPAELDVAAGDIVRFVNQDSAPHTATADGGAFDTGRLNNGDAKEVEIPAGEHSYKCLFHPAMTGTIRAS